MFTCAKIKDGSTYLSSHLTANDYYCENEHVTGPLGGQGRRTPRSVRTTPSARTMPPSKPCDGTSCRTAPAGLLRDERKMASASSTFSARLRRASQSWRSLWMTSACMTLTTKRPPRRSPSWNGLQPIAPE